MRLRRKLLRRFGSQMHCLRSLNLVDDVIECASKFRHRDSQCDERECFYFSHARNNWFTALRCGIIDLRICHNFGHTAKMSTGRRNHRQRSGLCSGTALVMLVELKQKRSGGIK